MSQRFVPNSKAANQQNIGVAVLLLVVIPVLFWFMGEHSLIKLLLYGSGTAAAAYIFYSLRTLNLGVRELALDPAGITLQDRSGTHSLAWSEVERAELLFRGGERWVLYAPKPKPPLTLWLDVFTSADGTQISKLIQEHTGTTPEARQP